MRGRAELLVGVTAGILGVLIALAATFVPLYGSRVYVTEENPDGTTHVLQNTQNFTSFFQAKGAPTALLVCGTFVVLSIWILLAAVTHVRRPNEVSLYLLWAGTVVLGFMCTFGGGLFNFSSSISFLYLSAPLLPVAGLAVVCAILATVQQAQVSQV